MTFESLLKQLKQTESESQRLRAKGEKLKQDSKAVCREIGSMILRERVRREMDSPNRPKHGRDQDHR